MGWVQHPGADRSCGAWCEQQPGLPVLYTDGSSQLQLIPCSQGGGTLGRKHFRKSGMPQRRCVGTEGKKKGWKPSLQKARSEKKEQRCCGHWSRIPLQLLERTMRSRHPLWRTVVEPGISWSRLQPVKRSLQEQVLLARTVVHEEPTLEQAYPVGLWSGLTLEQFVKDCSLQ